MFSWKHVFAPSEEHLCCDGTIACQIAWVFDTADHNSRRKVFMWYLSLNVIINKLVVFSFSFVYTLSTHSCCVCGYTVYIMSEKGCCEILYNSTWHVNVVISIGSFGQERLRGRKIHVVAFKQLQILQTPSHVNVNELFGTTVRNLE